MEGVRESGSRARAQTAWQCGKRLGRAPSHTNTLQGGVGGKKRGSAHFLNDRREGGGGE